MAGRLQLLIFGAAISLLPEVVAAGDRELGQYLSSECVTCHQMSGRASGGVPQIVGWPEDQFVAVMTAYKTKQLDHPVMQTIAGRLADDDIAALATFFASMSPEQRKK